MRLGIAALTLITALALVGGCEPEVDREVLLIADSVTVESTRQIVESFNNVEADGEAGRYAPVFGSTVSGQGLTKIPGLTPEEVDAYWAAHLASLLEHVDPEVIVVELGTNDCATLTGYAARIDAFMGAIPAEVPVHWLTVADPRKERTCDTTINNELKAAATRFPNLTLLPFATFLNPHPEWSRDGVHLNEAGQHQYAEWLHQQLDARYATGG